MSKQTLPKWFTGEMYEEGATVQNRFSGEEAELTAAELSMYDFIMGATMMMEMAIILILISIARLAVNLITDTSVYKR